VERCSSSAPFEDRDEFSDVLVWTPVRPLLTIEVERRLRDRLRKSSLSGRDFAESLYGGRQVRLVVNVQRSVERVNRIDRLSVLASPFAKRIDVQRKRHSASAARTSKFALPHRTFSFLPLAAASYVWNDLV
jgi:hypothetical protein